MRDTSNVQDDLTGQRSAGDQEDTGVEGDAGEGDEDVGADPGQKDAAQWHRPSRSERRIGIRELRQHASIYVDLAEKGYTVDITNRGRLVAQLVPAKEPESPMERLMAAGLIEPADEPGDLRDLEPFPPHPPSQAEHPGKPTLTEAFLRMREDER
jgi:prevent-host-death family protein